MNYSDYIKSSAWKKKRKARLEIDGHKCRLCDEDGTRFRLEVHHRPDSYKLIPNESIESDLLTVCSRCHDVITSAIREDRYDGREIEIPITTNSILERMEIRHGLANNTIQIDRISPSNNAQRADSRSIKQMVTFDKADFVKKEKDRRRL